MHHRRARNEAERADIPNGYERSKRVYRARYGQEPPEELWGPTMKVTFIMQWHLVTLAWYDTWEECNESCAGGGEGPSKVP